MQARHVPDYILSYCFPKVMLYFSGNSMASVSAESRIISCADER